MHSLWITPVDNFFLVDIGRAVGQRMEPDWAAGFALIEQIDEEIGGEIGDKADNKKTRKFF